MIIIGGGLAGLATAVDLGRSGVDIILIEKDAYPSHKVCGEYVSNEVLPYLKKLGVDPFEVGAKPIKKLRLTRQEGTMIDIDLDIGGFGISRHALDHMLYKRAREYCTIIQDRVTSISRSNDSFSVSTREGNTYIAKTVVGAYGKRSNLDMVLARGFIKRRTPWMAVKGHYSFSHPDDCVSLHQFEGGYCGLSRVETNAVNACYLLSNRVFKQYSNIKEFEQKVFGTNPWLSEFVRTAEPLFPKPLTISQISFKRKQAIHAGVFMVGDSAGLIHPLCGNGMAMALRAANIWSTLYRRYKIEDWSRSRLEARYTNEWRQNFSSRLYTGSIIQRALLNNITARLGFGLLKTWPASIPWIISKTHGKPF